MSSRTTKRDWLYYARRFDELSKDNDDGRNNRRIAAVIFEMSDKAIKMMLRDSTVKKFRSLREFIREKQKELYALVEESKTKTSEEEFVSWFEKKCVPFIGQVEFIILMAVKAWERETPQTSWVG